MSFLRIVCVILGALGILDSAAVSLVSSMNLGVLLPGLLGLPLLLAGTLLPRVPAGGPWHTVFAAAAVCYGLLLIAFAVTWIRIDSEARSPAPKDADALIVLGAGLHGEIPTLVLANRMDRAIAYLNENPRTVAVLSGGKGGGEAVSEASAMARYFSAHGIPASRYILEDASESTEENFRFSGRIIRERFGGDASVVFVTSDFHVFRAGRVAAKQGIRASGISAPDVWYLCVNNHLRECAAVWKYALTGGI